MTENSQSIARAIESIAHLGLGGGLTAKISDMEQKFEGVETDEVSSLLEAFEIDDSTLIDALAIKAAVGQINVLVHAVGILTALPHILEPGETIESLSLGAGNSGRAHDLETTHRIAEFKFIAWTGRSDTIRENSVFADVFNLAEAKTTKRRQLFVPDSTHVMRFLHNKRAISSVLSKNVRMKRRFEDAYGDSDLKVFEYWETVRETVEIVDLDKAFLD